MVVLSNPQPVAPSNPMKPLPFKQVNTGDYDKQKIQDNVRELANYISSTLQNLILNVVVNNPQPTIYNLTAASASLLTFQTPVVNDLTAYNVQLSKFIAPHAGVYTTIFNGSFTWSGAPTYILVQLVSSNQGILSSQLQLTAGVAILYFNLGNAVNVQDNEALYYQITVDITTSVTLGAGASSYFGGGG